MTQDLTQTPDYRDFITTLKQIEQRREAAPPPGTAEGAGPCPCPRLGHASAGLLPTLQAGSANGDISPAGSAGSRAGTGRGTRAGPSRQTIDKWKREAEKRILNGLTAILDHFSEHIRYEGMTYAGIRDLLSEADYEIACCMEIRNLQRQGMNWTAMAETLNGKAIPLPVRSGKGKWTASKVRPLMA